MKKVCRSKINASILSNYKKTNPLFQTHPLLYRLTAVAVPSRRSNRSSGARCAGAANATNKRPTFRYVSPLCLPPVANSLSTRAYVARQENEQPSSDRHCTQLQGTVGQTDVRKNGAVPQGEDVGRCGRENRIHKWVWKRKAWSRYRRSDWHASATARVGAHVQ